MPRVYAALPASFAPGAFSASTTLAISSTTTSSDRRLTQAVKQIPPSSNQNLSTNLSKSVGAFLSSTRIGSILWDDLPHSRLSRALVIIHDLFLFSLYAVQMDHDAAKLALTPD